MVHDPDTAIGGEAKRFPETRGTIVDSLRSTDSAARERASALLIEVYWKPLYKYLRIRWRKNNEEAKDLTQAFFLNALEKDALAAFDASKAAFRTFLRLLLDRFVANEEKSASRLKRGGAMEQIDFAEAEEELGAVADGGDPDAFLREEWVRSFFKTTVERLREELDASGRSAQFRIFELYDTSEDPRPSYREIAKQLELSEATVTNYLAAARRRFRTLLLDRLREITATEEEFRSEARALLGREA
jgi:RNA polymerase sigma factor (sigma-70 family)